MSIDLTTGIVRILQPNNQTAGTGFVLTADRLIATCAHVVAIAGVRPGDTVQLIFPATGEKAEALVLQEFWSEPNAEDVAILRLKNSLPERVEPLLLGTDSGTEGHPFKTFGFPIAKPVEGISGYGKIGDLTRENGYPVLQLTETTEVTSGFSGAPVWNQKTRRVVGMVTSILAPDEFERLGQTAFIIPTSTLKAVCPRLNVSEICPYCGLAAFTEDQAEFFYGRQKAVKWLLDKLKQEPRFLAVLGASGSGKSSLVQAGVIPQLKKRCLPGSDRWGILLARPRENPFEELTKIGLLNKDKDLPTAVQNWRENHPQQTRLVLILDQFEEILVSCSEELRRKFFLQLSHLSELDLPITVILVMRNDFYGRLAQQAPELMEWLQEGFLYNVPALIERDDLKSILLRPAEDVGLRFEEGLVEDIIDDLIKANPETEKGRISSPSTILPLLEFTLEQLWQERQEGMMTHEAYQKIGRVTGSLAKWANDAFKELEKQKLASLIRRIFTDLVHLGEPNEGVPDSKRRRQLVELYRGDESQQEKVTQVVKILADKRLLVTDSNIEDNRNVNVEIIHDALLTEWDKLQQWLRDDRSFLEWYQKIEEQAKRWEETGENIVQRDKDRLLRGRDLSTAEGWCEGREADLEPSVKLFIQTSLERQQREENKRKKQRRLVIGGLSAGIVVTTAISILALYQWYRGEQQLMLARAGEVKSLLLSEPTRGLVQAIETVGMSLSPWLRFPNRPIPAAVRDSLVSAIQLSREQNILRADQGVIFSVAISTDGQTIVSGGADGTVRLWNRKGKLLRTFQGHQDRVNSVAISADNQTVVSGGQDGTVRRWNWEGKPLGTFSGHQGLVYSVAISTDGQTIVSGGIDGTIRLWNRNGNLLRTFPGHHQGSVNSVAISTDAQTIVSGGADGTVRLWNRQGNLLSELFRSYGGSVTAVAISANDQLIVSGGYDGMVRLWNREDNILKELSAEAMIDSVAISADNQFIVSGGQDGTVRLWNRKGIPLGVFRGHQGFVPSVAVSADSQLIVSGSDDGVRLWEGKSLRESFQGHQDLVASVAISADNQFIVSGSHDGTVRLWDRKGNSLGIFSLGTFPDEQNEVFSVAISADSQLIVSGSADGTVRLWDRKGKPLETFRGHQDLVREVAISADSQTIVSGGDDGTVRLWDRKGKPLETFRGRQGFVLSVAISSDNKLIVSGGSDGTINLWSRQGKLLDTFPGHKGWVTSVAISNDNQFIVSIGYDGIVRLWDRKGNSLGTFKGHQVGYASVTISNDSQFIVSGGDDGMVRLWDREGNSLGTFLSGQRSVDSVAISSDDQTIVSGGRDGTVRLWEVSWESWLKVGCQRLRYHPVFDNPSPGSSAAKAKNTCERYVWKP